MPHLFVNRPRLHDLLGDDPELRDHFRWETINAVVYAVGGVVFVIVECPHARGLASAGASRSP